jgi:hypothetical protein
VKLSQITDMVFRDHLPAEPPDQPGKLPEAFVAYIMKMKMTMNAAQID